MLARRRAFPGLPYAGVWPSEAQQGSFIKVAGARGTWAEAAVPCLTPYTHAGHGGRHSPLAKTCWEGWAVFLHTPCSHPCSKSKSRGILSSVHLFKEV